METYDALCDPDEHCYHEDNGSLLQTPKVYASICCNCGHTQLSPLANVMSSPDYEWYQ